MKDFLRKNGILLLVIALLLSILIGVTSSLLGGNADPLSNVVSTVTAPIRSGVSAVANWAEGVYNYVFRYGQSQEELSDLRGGHPAPGTAAPAASGSAAKLSASQIEAISQSLLQQLRG